MTILLFKDRGWEIATSSWSAGAQGTEHVTICYQWGLDGVGWAPSSIGVSRVTLKLNMDEFTQLIATGTLVDLRDKS